MTNATIPETGSIMGDECPIVLKVSINFGEKQAQGEQTY